MKILKHLIGAFALGLISLQASGVAKISQDEINAPNGDNSNCTQLVQQCLDDVPSSFSIGYVGGFMGPTNTIYVQTGVYVNLKESPANDGYKSINLDWGHGIELSGTYNLNNGTAFRLEALGMFKNKSSASVNTGEGLVLANGTPHDNATLNRTGILSATASYRLLGFAEAMLTSMNPIISLPTFQVVGKVGLTGAFLEHDYILQYTTDDNSSRYDDIENEQIYGGPVMGLSLIKEWFGFYFEGNFNMGINASTTDYWLSSEVTTTPSGFDISTKGTMQHYFQKNSVNLAVAYLYNYSDFMQFFGYVGYTASIAYNCSNVLSSFEPQAAGFNTDIFGSYFNASLGMTF